MRRAPPHLEERATTLEGALACALEAESFSQQQASRAHKLSHLLGVPAPAPALIKNGSESDDDTVQPPIVRRLPNLKVFLFDGLEYTGTYVGEVGDGGIPHGLGDEAITDVELIMLRWVSSHCWSLLPLTWKERSGTPRGLL